MTEEEYNKGWRINRKTGGKFNIYDEYEPNKERNIKHNQAESQKLNKESELPKRLSLNDISADTANKTTDILDLISKQRYRFKPGTKITGAYVFAGKGCSKEFRDAEKYARRYGGKASDWQHCAGYSTIVNNNRTLNIEVHWVQSDKAGVKEAFIKRVIR